MKDEPADRERTYLVRVSCGNCGHESMWQVPKGVLSGEFFDRRIGILRDPRPTCPNCGCGFRSVGFRIL